MLPKPNRLKKKKDFERVFKEGKGYKENFLYFKIANNGLKTSRFGFIVGKNFSGKATQRNRIKRRLREAVRMNLPNIKSGFDVIIIVLPGFAIDNFWETEEIIKKLFQKAKMIGH